MVGTTNNKVCPLCGQPYDYLADDFEIAQSTYVHVREKYGVGPYTRRCTPTNCKRPAPGEEANGIGDSDQGEAAA